MSPRVPTPRVSLECPPEYLSQERVGMFEVNKFLRGGAFGLSEAAIGMSSSSLARPAATMALASKPLARANRVHSQLPRRHSWSVAGIGCGSFRVPIALSQQRRFSAALIGVGWQLCRGTQVHHLERVGCRKPWDTHGIQDAAHASSHWLHPLSCTNCTIVTKSCRARLEFVSALAGNRSKSGGVAFFPDNMEENWEGGGAVLICQKAWVGRGGEGVHHSSNPSKGGGGGRQVVFGSGVWCLVVWWCGGGVVVVVWWWW